MATRALSSLASALAFALYLSQTPAQAPPTCNIQLSVKLTPDVPDPRDPSFLSSLVVEPAYHLIWIRTTDTRVMYQLTGPGPDYRCREEIGRIGQDGRVLDIQVVHPGGSSM